MKKKMLEKLRSRRGDSIAEVLVAMLISAVALVMLASMIASSGRMIRRSRESMEEYDKANNALAAMNEGGTVGELKIQDAASKTVYLETGKDNIPVTVYENAGYAGKTVVAYKKG